MSRPVLGVIEGFYGRSWSWKERAECLRFLSSNSGDLYIYAPKSDAVLRRDWKQDWSKPDFLSLLQCRLLARECGVQWGLGLSPFELHADYSPANKKALQKKIERLNALELDVLCVLFDDMANLDDSSVLVQVEIAEDIAAWSNADKILVCPSYYSFDAVLDKVFGERPVNYLAQLGDNLSADIGLFWTGNQVISQVIDGDDLESVQQLLKRKPWLWDNLIANDGEKGSQFLNIKAMTGRSSSLAQSVSGHLVNPMNQPALSQVALYTLPLLYNCEYDADKSFTAALTGSCDKSLALALERDALFFSEQGRDALSAEVKLELIEKYKTLSGSMAQEVVDWLEGGYQFDSACLTD